MERLRTLSEECYLRCYGWRGSDDSVKVLRSPLAVQPDLRAERSEADERLRRLLELRLDAREAA
jgi:hypothetical protein